jgi:hypothetical protein
MHGVMTVVIGFMMLATLGIVLAGMLGLARSSSPRRSNKLMQYRVAFQFATLVLLILFMWLLKA